MKGQALVESLFTYVLIFLISFCVIELVRLQSFKTLLQISVNYYTKYIALEEMSLIRNHHFNIDSKQIFKSDKLEKSIKKYIADDLALMRTTLFAFDPSSKKLIHHNIRIDIELLTTENKQSPPGIYLKAQTCLPVLFSGFLNQIINNGKNIIGRKIKKTSHDRDCMGEFIDTNTIKKHNAPHFWFRVRAAGYSPWPSSTQIFYKGFKAPKKMKRIESQLYQKFIERIDRVDLDNILKFTKQNQ